MRYGFFNSEMTGTDENGMPIFDRAEQADFFAKYFSSFVRDGVSPTSFNASCSAANVTLSPGVVFIQGYFGWEDEPTVLTMSSAVQYIAARLDLGQRTITMTVKDGSSAPTRSGDIYELYLYRAFFANGVVTLEDLRTDDVFCGIVGAANPKIYCGTQDPSDSFGQDGDLFIRY